MRCKAVALLGVAWAVLGLATAGAWAQSPGGHPEEFNRDQETFPTANYEALLEEVSRLRDRVSSLETTQDPKKKEAAAPAADDHGPFCCDGKKAKEIPLRANAYRIGGRIFWDNYWFDQDDGSRALVGDEQNSTGFRAARISVEGNLWENIEYQMELDIAGFNTPTADGTQANDQETLFKNVYMQMVEIPMIKTIRVGHFKEPFGLEQLTSQRYITFMERCLSDRAFVPGRNMGLQIGGDLGHYKDAGWWMGVFHSEDNEDPAGTSRDPNDWAYTGRFIWLPYYDECSEGRYLVHVGGGLTYRNFGDGTVRYRTRPELGGGSTPDPGDWLDFNVSAFNDYVANAEAAVVWGPLSLQGEYFRSHANTTVGPDKDYHGWYVQVSYFLTGEHRDYHRGNKVFQRVKVHENAWWVDTLGGWCFGKGAWELCARYDRLDLEDGGGAAVLDPSTSAFDGREGEMEHYTIGLNWYLNPYCRVMFNYIHSNLEVIDGREGEAHLFGTRCQVDW